jgi:hypothetical protein
MIRVGFTINITVYILDLLGLTATIDAATGNVLFGGIDTAKFTGDLKRVDVIPRTDRTGKKTFDRFVVDLASIAVGDGKCGNTIKSQDFPLPVLVDSGDSFVRLPDKLFDQVASNIGASFEKANGFVIPCDFANSGAKVTFQMGGSDGAKIEVPANQVVIPVNNPDIFASGPNKGKTKCISGIQGGGNDLAVVGDTFMRSAYIVYDLVNNQLAFAQTKFNVTESNIVPFDSMGARIPKSLAIKNAA